MRIGAVIGVKDEIELMPRCLDHLAAIGVEAVIVCDRGSTDGTREFLADQEGEGRLRLLDLDPLESISDAKWGITQLDIAAQTGADWVLFQDADEFWIPATGSIADCVLPSVTDIVQTARFNVPLLPTGPVFPDPLVPARYADLLLFVRHLPAFREHLSTDASLSWIQGVPMPKVAVRSGRVTGLEPGHHHAVSIQSGRPAWLASDVFIAHLPFTTLSRFERKVVNIGETMRAHPEFFEGNRAWHWARWFAQLEQGTLGQEFERQMLSTDEVATLRETGAIASAAELFADVSGRGNGLQTALSGGSPTGRKIPQAIGAGRGARLRGFVRVRNALGRRRPG